MTVVPKYKHFKDIVKKLYQEIKAEFDAPEEFNTKKPIADEVIEIVKLASLLAYILYWLAHVIAYGAINPFTDMFGTLVLFLTLTVIEITEFVIRIIKNKYKFNKTDKEHNQEIPSHKQ